MKGTCRSIILCSEQKYKKNIKKIKSSAKTNDYKPGFRHLNLVFRLTKINIAEESDVVFSKFIF